MDRLQVVPTSGEPYIHSFEGDLLTIGRSTEADLTLADRFLSRLHARIVRDGDRLLLEDLGSYNGTLLNDRPLSGPTELRPGDVIRLSGVLIILEGEEGTGRSPGEATLPTTSGPGDGTLYRHAEEILERAPSSGPPPTEDRDRLRTYAERMRILNEVHQALARPNGLEPLLDLILEHLVDHLGAEQGVVVLVGADGEPYRAATRLVEGEDLLFSRSLMEEVIGKGMAALVNDARTDSRFAGAESILLSGVRSIAAAPLLTHEGVEGMIALSSRLHVREFTEGDLELLVSLASVAALHLRNVWLTEEAAERRRLEEEMNLARDIQVSLLPSRLPAIEGYELHGGNVPSRTVSGDYYVVVPRDEGRECVLMVTDVSGKGIGAALLTASLEGLASGLIEIGQPPETICSLVSGQLHARTPPEKYATAFVSALDLATGTLRYCNAGHNAALLVRGSGRVDLLSSTAPPVGLMPGVSFEGADAALGPEDLLVIYTDGITEAVDAAEEEYGIERLAEVCTTHRRLPLAELGARIERDLERFVGDVPFVDDRTLVLLRRAAAERAAEGTA